ncbi:metal-dependent hydrolase [Spongiactinospora sp. TRM90649]|uniref:metal-dependent hydrolase n=1 Tax=Spongiactinospora sp. TRM90649 TaxID=3031114 RepID=UPI0023F7A596|nr:metal-dependent hydrolase [Spongiactinospora sp. TRM90649]MDF5755293.1 metal-dependent hydrolase [Spongiactinospora sp. TRM90649]
MRIGGSTRITYPAGALSGSSPIIAVVPRDDRYAVVVEETPFHPLDHTWPDQPADTGTLNGVPVLDCVTGAIEHGGTTLYLGHEIPVRRGQPGWHWLVVHLTGEVPAESGERAELAVEPAGRLALSAGHTACHLTALALNSALASRWRKAVAPDGLGNPDFDQAAITSSRILPYGSLDTYRLGKSLRKKGFLADGLAGELPGVAKQVGERLAEWIAADAPVWIDLPSPDLAARRTWRCGLPDGEVAIPCGGTHLPGTGRLGAVSVTLDLSDDAAELTMRTTVTGTP